MFIVDKLKSGEMTVIDNCHLWSVGYTRGG
jgi:hypothetical protein